MHILIIPSWYPAGAGDPSGSFFRDQAKALKDHGHQVGVLAPCLLSLLDLHIESMQLRSSTRFELDEGIPTYRVRVLNLFPRTSVLSTWLLARHTEKVYSAYIREHGIPDVLHAHCALPAGIIATQLRYKKAPRPLLFLTEHSSEYSRGVLNARQRALARQAFAKADHWVFVSSALRADVQSVLGLSQGPTSIVPNLVSDRFFHSIYEPKRSITTDAPVFINVAALLPVKDHRTLINAFAVVVRRIMGSRLRIVGDGPEREHLEHLALDLGIRGSIDFLGRRPTDEIPGLLANADIFVLSSRSETFGVAIAEALSMGLPVVSTRCGGPDGFLSEDDGLLADVGDSQSLAVAMISVATGKRSYDRVAIQHRAQERFSAARIATSLTDLYKLTQKND